jgi:hypothetical protein
MCTKRDLNVTSSTEGYLSIKSAIMHLGVGFGPLLDVFGYKNIYKKKEKQSSRQQRSL